MPDPCLDVAKLGWKLRNLRDARYDMRMRLREIDSKIERLEKDVATAKMNEHLAETELPFYLVHEHRGSYP